MFQVVTMWNLVDPINDADLTKDVKNVRLRGYESDAYLTGRFATAINEEEISPLSVSDIADKYCPTRTDLYFRKGSKRDYRRRSRRSWGGTAGRVTQFYISDLFSAYLKSRNIKKYDEVIEESNKFSTIFKDIHSRDIDSLGDLAEKEYEDPERLLKLLTFNGRLELGMKLMHSLLSKGEENIDFNDIAFQEAQVKINPTPIQIGISTPATPDFLAEKYGAVGDIKSGVKFEDHYLLTCAGYALAYENWKRKERKNINFGIIYFFPTRIPTDYAKPFTFAQMYIFPIDDALRTWFLEERDSAYETIIKDSIPDFPENKQHCKHCQYIKACIEMGLDV